MDITNCDKVSLEKSKVMPNNREARETRSKAEKMASVRAKLTVRKPPMKRAPLKKKQTPKALQNAGQKSLQPPVNEITIPPNVAERAALLLQQLLPANLFNVLQHTGQENQPLSEQPLNASVRSSPPKTLSRLQIDKEASLADSMTTRDVPPPQQPLPLNVSLPVSAEQNKTAEFVPESSAETVLELNILPLQQQQFGPLNLSLGSPKNKMSSKHEIYAVPEFVRQPKSQSSTATSTGLSQKIVMPPQSSTTTVPARHDMAHLDTHSYPQGEWKNAPMWQRVESPLQGSQVLPNEQSSIAEVRSKQQYALLQQQHANFKQQSEHIPYVVAPWAQGNQWNQSSNSGPKYPIPMSAQRLHHPFIGHSQIFRAPMYGPMPLGPFHMYRPPYQPLNMREHQFAMKGDNHLALQLQQPNTFAREVVGESELNEEKRRQNENKLKNKIRNEKRRNNKFQKMVGLAKEELRQEFEAQLLGNRQNRANCGVGQDPTSTPASTLMHNGQWFPGMSMTMPMANPMYNLFDIRPYSAIE